MVASVSVRRLGVDDLADYVALRMLMLQAHPENFTSDAEGEASQPADALAQRLASGPLKDGRFTLGAWRGDAVQGGDPQAPRLLGALTCERDARAKVRHIGHLVGMMVRPEAQRCGIGWQLLAACLQTLCSAPGIELLTLSVTASNEAAVALYRRAGFVRYGSLPNAIKIGAAYHAKDLMVLALQHDSR